MMMLSGWWYRMLYNHVRHTLVVMCSQPLRLLFSRENATQVTPAVSCQ